MTTLDEFLHKHPVDWDEVERINNEMRQQQCGHQLREYRESLTMPAAEFATTAGIGPDIVSQIENDDISSLRIADLERYATTLGMTLRITTESSDNVRSIPVYASHNDTPAPPAPLVT